MYKEGDRVIIKSWDELAEEFGTYGDDDTNIDLYVLGWSKYLDSYLPSNRIIIIANMHKGVFRQYTNNKEMYVPRICIKMIKGYTNEYYLQQIKDEL